MGFTSAMMLCICLAIFASSTLASATVKVGARPAHIVDRPIAAQGAERHYQCRDI